MLLVVRFLLDDEFAKILLLAKFGVDCLFIADEPDLYDQSVSLRAKETSPGHATYLLIIFRVRHA
jgi:hypothetical protein